MDLSSILPLLAGGELNSEQLIEKFIEQSPGAAQLKPFLGLLKMRQTNGDMQKKAPAQNKASTAPAYNENDIKDIKSYNRLR